MENDAPLFDKTNRARLAEKLDQLLAAAAVIQQTKPDQQHDALLRAIPRLFRRAAMLVGAYGFGIEAQRIDAMLTSRSANLLQTTDSGSLTVVTELVHLLEDIAFLASDDVRKLAPLLKPTVPTPPANLRPTAPSKPLSKPVPTLKAPIKRTVIKGGRR